MSATQKMIGIAGEHVGAAAQKIIAGMGMQPAKAVSNALPIMGAESLVSSRGLAKPGQFPGRERFGSGWGRGSIPSSWKQDVPKHTPLAKAEAGLRARDQGWTPGGSIARPNPASSPSRLGITQGMPAASTGWKPAGAAGSMRGVVGGGMPSRNLPAGGPGSMRGVVGGPVGSRNILAGSPGSMKGVVGGTPPSRNFPAGGPGSMKGVVGGSSGRTTMGSWNPPAASAGSSPVQNRGTWNAPPSAPGWPTPPTTTNWSNGVTGGSGHSNWAPAGGAGSMNGVAGAPGSMTGVVGGGMPPAIAPPPSSLPPVPSNRRMQLDQIKRFGSDAMAYGGMYAGIGAASGAATGFMDSKNNRIWGATKGAIGGAIVGGLAGSGVKGYRGGVGGKAANITSGAAAGVAGFVLGSPRSRMNSNMINANTGYGAM